mmetsp:Transcript_85335/g.241862  ORF Transcript_85335/g.241862 Transcript_85335/m.241862 type:complete len:206 (-) Transcript_85335:1541-2158(-)
MNDSIRPRGLRRSWLFLDGRFEISLGACNSQAVPAHPQDAKLQEDAIRSLEARKNAVLSIQLPGILRLQTPLKISLLQCATCAIGIRWRRQVCKEVSFIFVVLAECIDGRLVLAIWLCCFLLRRFWILGASCQELLKELVQSCVRLCRTGERPLLVAQVLKSPPLAGRDQLGLVVPVNAELEQVSAAAFERRQHAAMSIQLPGLL